MNQSDPLELVDAGTLARPGAVGRLVRLGLGALCLYALSMIVGNAEAIIAQPFSSLDDLVLPIVFPLFVLNYVVNIGFSKSWGRRPLIVSLIALGLSAGIALLLTGSPDSPIFGVPLMLWLTYFYAHLGIAFVLASLIATPGCEMRSIPEVIARVTGNPSDEHHCPASFITKIDAWEQRRLQRP